jgi:hypothetical protein
MYVSEPRLQIRSNCAVFFYLPTVRPPTGHKNLKLPAYTGKVTSGARKRILSAIDILLQITPTRSTWNPVTKKYFPFQLNFVTLTVSDQRNLTAVESYQNLMKPFLRKLRSLGDFSYVWKAELQKRGQIHYHLATNTFLPWSDIRNNWNNLQRKHRYLDDYAMKNGHFNANSTDVHAISQIRDVGSYLAKYMGKDDTASIRGKVWDCSKNLKRPRFTFTPTNQQELLLRQLQDDKHVKVVELEHCTIFKGLRPSQIFTQQNYTDYQMWKS